jgi:DNA-binding FrmR family transcriptional regulator
MAGPIPKKQELLAGVHRVGGQLEAIERSLESDVTCETILHQLAAVRADTVALMATVIEAHVQSLSGDQNLLPDEVGRQVIDVLRSYLK